MKLVSCGAERAEAILAILNEAIVNTTALYDYQPRTPEMMAAWFEAKARGNFPVLGALDEAGELMGFGSYGTFRAFPAFKYSVEHSVYVDRRFRGRGVGRLLLESLLKAASAQEYHTLIGVIDSSNAVSIGLHRALGFSHCGSLRQAGFKFGRWLDVEFYQRILSTPAAPHDG